MKIVTKDSILFAVYKSSVHKGNVRADNIENAILKYIKDSNLPKALVDENLLNQYFAKIAIKNEHY